MPNNYKAGKLDLSPLLAMPVSAFTDLIFDQRAPGLLVWDSMASIDILDMAPCHANVEVSPTLRLARSLPPDRYWDRRLLVSAAPLIDTPGADILPVVRVSGAITNENRAFGASLSYAISIKFQEAGLPKTRRLEVSFVATSGSSSSEKGWVVA